MPQENKISSVEAIFLIVTIMINHIILNLPKALIDLSGTSTILNIVFVSIIVLLIIHLICKLFKFFPGQDILDISEFLGGKVFKYIIGTLFILYFLFTASTFLRSFCESVKIIYFYKTPIIILMSLFIIGIIFCSKLGLNSIIRSNLIFIPLVLLSIFFIFLANIGNFTPERLLPIFGNGLNSTFFSGISNMFAFGGIALLYFIPPHLKESREFKKVAYISIILSSIWLLISIATLIFIFPFVVTTDEIMPLYLASRFIEFGRFFQRLDAIFLFIWIISMMSYLSIVVSYTSHVFKKITNLRHQSISIYLICLIVFLLGLIPQNYAQIHFLETTVYKYAVLALVFIISLAILSFAVIKYKKKNKKGAALTDEIY